MDTKNKTNEDFLLFVGNRIKQARLKANLSQEKLASRLGKTQQFLPPFENGRRAIRIDLLAEIASACNVPITFFFVESEISQEGLSILNNLDLSFRSIAVEQLTSLSKAQRA